ncbi:MAG: hypothetical protein AAF614_44660, partial [Chloroflexota bacterium]
LLFISTLVVSGQDRPLRQQNKETFAIQLANINQTATPNTEFRFGLSIGDTLFFTADDGQRGTQLWRTDGTESGTHIVKDLSAGWRQSSNYEIYTEIEGQFQNKVIFSARPTDSGDRHWITDGTSDGTIPLQSIHPSLESIEFISANDNYILYSPRYHEVWRTDGTAEGTIFLLNVRAWDGIRASHSIYFNANQDLFHTNGTPEGTYSLQQPPFIKAVPRGNSIFFFSSRGLSITSGTLPSTKILLDSSQGNVVDMHVLNNLLFFTMEDDPWLWQSDGTVEGTKRLLQLANTDGLLSSMRLVGNQLFLTSHDSSNGTRLWRTDGTTNGTSVINIPGEISNLTPVDNQLYFLTKADNGQGHLWSTDGTQAGTRIISPYLFPFNTYLRPSTIGVGNKLYFMQESSEFGREIWVTDGSTPRMVKDINAQTNSDPRNFTAMQDQVFFSAYDGLKTGYELWRTDGGTSTTRLVKDIYPSGYFSYPDGLNFNGRYLFFARTDRGVDLWESDGTPENTYMINDLELTANESPYPRHIRIIEKATNLFYFTEWVSPENILWRSDGSETGTFPIGPVDISRDHATAHVGDMLFFVSDEDDSLWRSDGSEAGLQTVLDLNDDQRGNLREITAVNDKLFFAIYPYNVDTGTYYELWVSDGTPAGTKLIKSDTNLAYFRNLTDFNGHLYFIEKVTQLWRTDGTPDGTEFVLELAPDDALTGTSDFIAIGDLLYFVGRDAEHDWDLWRTDGTLEGTFLVKDINPTGPALISNLTNFNGLLAFTAIDGVHGEELWLSDGTEAGTFLAADIHPKHGSNPTNLTPFQDALIFSANDGTGTEPWILTYTEISPGVYLPIVTQP